MFWRLMFFYIHMLFLLQPSVLWLSIVTFNNDAKPLCAKVYFARIWYITNPTATSRVTPPWSVYMAKFDPGWEGYPVWQTGLPALAGHPIYHVNVIKLKWKIICLDRRVTSPTWDPPLPCKQAFSSRRVCCSLSQFVFGIPRENSSYLHTKQRPLWLHVSFLTHLNQPLPINNTTALRSA